MSAASTALHRGYRHPFLVGTLYHGGVGDKPRTLSDMAMSHFSAELRKQKEWWMNLEDEQTREEWTQNAISRVWAVRTASGHVDVKLSLKQIDYVLDELKGYAALRDNLHGCQASCFERIWESGSLLSYAKIASLNAELMNLSTNRVRTEDGATIILIDPLSHPLIYDKTVVYDKHLRLQTRPKPPATIIFTVSREFCLLPSDVSIDSLGRAHFKSYINNVDPKKLELYGLLELLFTGFIPLFEHTLTDLHRSNPLQSRITESCKYTVWDEPDPPEYSDDEEGWQTYERDMRHWVVNRPISLPDVDKYTGNIQHRNHVVSFGAMQLQVIVSVTRTRLEPGESPYAGSPWHVQGMRNERIVACGMYFASVENISNSCIQFRMAVTSPRVFSAGDAGAVSRTWGMNDGDPCYQHLPSVDARTGFAVVFPNIYQHRQSEFTLTDPSKPGSQTIVMFSLVDPDVQPLISTAMVPPQQEEWIKQAVDEWIDLRLPNEVVEKITAGVDGLLGAEEADTYRETMVQERRRFRVLNNNYYFCVPLDIWNDVS